MIEVVNRQRKIKLHAEDYQQFAEEAAGAVEKARGKDFTVAFVSDRRIRQLNKTYRQKDKVTDVLSFPHEADNLYYFETENFLGDIIISVEQAERQARDNDLSLDHEIKQLILHGVLHLCGYDHQTDSGEMDRLELKLRKKLKI